MLILLFAGFCLSIAVAGLTLLLFLIFPKKKTHGAADNDLE